MATNYDLEFYLMDPGNPPAQGTHLTPTTETVLDRNDDHYLSPGKWWNPGAADKVNGSPITDVWEGDTINVLIDGTPKTITGVTFYTSDGSRYFSATDGSKLQNAVFQSSTYVTDSTKAPIGNLSPPCFTAGSLIATPRGPRPVESLNAGDMVLTRDNGAQPVRWVGQRRVAGDGRFAPIRFAAGTLGNTRPLLVSPQHRMLVTGWRAELLFGQDEVLVAAKHLVDGDRICRAPCRSVHYVHILFDRHEIVEAEGAACESFHPGEHILAEDAELRAEVLDLFPELAAPDAGGAWVTARTVLKAHEGQLMRRAA